MPNRASTAAATSPGAAASGVLAAAARGPGVQGLQSGRGVQLLAQGGAQRLDGGGVVPSACCGGAVGAQALGGPIQLGLGPFPVGAVVVGHQHQADDHRVQTVAHQTVDEDEVAQGLAHLFALMGDHPGVVVHRGEAAAQAHCVRGGQVVMGEDQVAAAGLDVEGQAEGVARDAHALHVPPGAPAAQCTGVPGRFALALGAPQQGVEHAPFALALGIPAALGEDLHHLLFAVAGDVAQGPVHPQIEVPVGAGGVSGLDWVGAAALMQLLDDRDDGVDRLAHGAVGLRGDDPQGGHVLGEQLDLGGGQLLPVDPVAPGTLEQRVVDVGDVLGDLDLESGVPQRAVHQVRGVVGVGVPEVGGVVRGDPADIQPGGARRQRGHRGHSARARVVQAQRQTGGGQGGERR